MKRFIKSVSSLLCMGIVFSSGMFVTSPIVNAATGVKIDSVNFPDDKFRSHISTNVDKNSDGILSQSEIDATTVIDVYDINSSWLNQICDLKGIEYFTNLRELKCTDNQLKSIDLSKNTLLEYFECNRNKLTSLDLSHNKNLTIVYCESNQLKNINLSNSANLTELYCSYNELEKLDLSGCSSLYSLWCSQNMITSLDVRNCANLHFINCQVNKIAVLDVSKNAALEGIVCSSNLLTSLDVSSNPELRELWCDDNKLTSIDVSQNTMLRQFGCGDNDIRSIDVSANADLTQIVCQGNGLTELDISNNPLINNLNCNQNKLTTLDISNNPDLCDIACWDNPIATIDFSNNPVLIDTVKNATPQISSIVQWIYNKNGSVMGVAGVSARTTVTANGEVLYSPGTFTTPTPTATATPTPTPTVTKSVGSFVDRCYEVALGRDADEDGYYYWLVELKIGDICGAQVGYGFIFSDEYAAKETTNEQFVTDLYNMYFGRTPDGDGFNYWVGLLNAGTSREEVFAGFANSQEFDNLCDEYGVVTGAYIVGVPNDQQGGVNSFVARLYSICLDRRPDMGGQSGWVQKLLSSEVTGTMCAYGFVFSPEFMGLGLSNEEFVSYMYRAFFDREADEAGFNSWVQVLNDGGSYEDVFNGFTGSAEFFNLCASYGINV